MPAPTTVLRTPGGVTSPFANAHTGTRTSKKRRRPQKTKLQKRARAGIEKRALVSNSSSARSARFAQQTIDDILLKIPTMPLSDLKLAIDQGRHPKAVERQPEIIRACLQRLLSNDPRPQQVDSLRRMIYCSGDTLLIARTGFGKSIIFHAFSVLTSLVTLQIVPLNSLGDEQLSDIRRHEGTNPVLLNAKSKSEEKGILEQIANGDFTHVLLGPEQACSKAFRTALKGPELQNRIGLVAIDECHLVEQWKDFRPAFALFGELRAMLRSSIVWFGCSATLDEASEKTVLQTGGFRPVGPNMHETMVLRTSIDRPDISICVIPIPRKKLGVWDSLYLLLSKAVDLDGDDPGATPKRIPKTVIFIDGLGTIQQAATWLQSQLVAMTASFPPHRRYTTDPNDGGEYVFNVVSIFTAQVAEFDRVERYTIFASPHSTIRLMFATSCLGMGVNIRDIALVVCWKFPITKSLADTWQRIGRGGRGEGIRSVAWVFLPYWVFDSEGSEGQSTVQAYKERKSQSTQSTQGSRRRGRHQLPAARGGRKSYLSIVQNANSTPGDLSDCDSAASGTDQSDYEDGTSQVNDSQETVAGDSQETIVGDSQETAVGNSRKGRLWTQSDMASRARLHKKWLKMVNGRCHRTGFLTELGEDKLPPEDRTVVEPAVCCSRCNPSLLPILIDPPIPPKVIGKPRMNTHAYFFSRCLQQWADKQADLRMHSEYRRFPAVTGSFMPVQLQYEIAYECVSGSIDMSAGLQFNTVAEKVPRLLEWDPGDMSNDEFIAALLSISTEACTQWDAHRSTRGQSRKEHSVDPTIGNGLPGSRESAWERQQSQNMSLAKLVAEQHMKHNAPVRKGGSMLAFASPIGLPTNVVTPSSALHDQLRDYARADSSQVDLPAGTDDASPSLKAAAQLLRNVRRNSQVESPSTTPVQSPRRVINSIDSGAASPSTRKKSRQNTDLETPSPRSKRARISERRPLQEIDSNVQEPHGMGLTFNQISRTGRKRTLTAKGQNVYQG